MSDLPSAREVACKFTMCQPGQHFCGPVTTLLEAYATLVIVACAKEANNLAPDWFGTGPARRILKLLKNIKP